MKVLLIIITKIKTATDGRRLTNGIIKRQLKWVKPMVLAATITD
jgi:hypothetical protein